MFTQCPKCQTTFRVTATMLKVAQGRVRCGRCAEVFDALASLMEKRSTSSPAGELTVESPDDEGADIPDSAMEFHLSADDLGKVFVVAPAPTIKRPVAGAEPAPPRIEEDTAEHEILDIEAEGGAPVEVITLEGDSIESSRAAATRSTEEDEADDDGEESSRSRSTAATPAPHVESRREATVRIDAEVRREIEAAFAADPTTKAEFVLPSGQRLTLNRTNAEAAAHEVLAQAREPRRIAPSHWIAGSTILGFLLVAQLVHANRQSLVRSPFFGPALGAIYATLGSELSPAWDVGAYELRQWGAAADPGSSGTLRVRASLLNGADHAQPYPLLRLTLQDRFGSEVASRALEPREYLHDEPGRNQLLGAGQRIDAEIAIVDPGKDAVGFEIDVCLRDPAGLKCASETRQSG